LLFLFLILLVTQLLNIHQETVVAAVEKKEEEKKVETA
jgi:hypothetical protein